ncbi:hypothetical protein [Rhodocyclus tenuis]|uniref:hypothetical protein n=1 Tax=Rhodocyclus tenuis TaxID=1066 RepID=UPI0019055C60|nr:hypothetical protein [Rhodocyclus tenuis]MBK1680369.1 hypothetical protein [Rhodocyclus tenuis]
MSKELITASATPAESIAAAASAAPGEKKTRKPAATSAITAAAAPAPAVKKTPARSARKATAAAAPATTAAAEVAAPAVPAESAPAAATAAPVDKAARKVAATKAARNKKPGAKKAKLVRDSFTFPENDYALFATLKQRALAAGGEIKKSELVRAGLALLDQLNDAELLKVLDKVERIKTGRPKK